MTRPKVFLAGAAATVALAVMGLTGGAAAGPANPSVTVYPPATTVAPTTVPPTTAAPTTTVPPAITVDKGTVPAGATIVITSEGHKPGTNVDFYIESTPVLLGSAIADSKGVATLTTKVPAGFSGSHTIKTVGVDPSGAPLVQTQPIVVTAGGGSGGGGMPGTGSNSTGTTLQIAAIALAAGLGMLGLAAIRRRGNAAS